jgi:hypothetical protein
MVAISVTADCLSYLFMPLMIMIELFKVDCKILVAWTQH